MKELCSLKEAVLILAVITPAVIVLATGCRSPQAAQQKQAAKVEAAKSAVHDTGDAVTEKAKGQVYATGYALDKSTNGGEPAIALAKTFAGHAQLTLGNPSYKESVDYERIITGILSTSKVERAAAEKALAAKDVVITGLQGKLDTLGAKLEKAEEKRDDAFVSIAAEAETWVKVKRWLRWGAFGLAGMIFLPILLKVASLAVPAIGPIAGVVDSILGGFVKAIFRLVPAVTAKAGVVAQEVNDKTVKALEHVVTAVQEAKKDPVVDAKLTEQLKYATDETTRATIKEVKQDLGIKA